MGLPWQADTAFCRSGYGTDYDPFVPTFWPARVPNQVLTEEGYQAVLERSNSPDERLAAFANRASWVRALTGSTAQQMEQMVRIYGTLGVVEVRDGVVDDPAFPARMMVESVPSAMPEVRAAPGAPPAVPASTVAGQPAPPVNAAELLRRRAVREAGWSSDEEAEKAPLPVRHPK
jgi:hypothetical protein